MSITLSIPESMQAVQVLEFNKPYEIRTIPVPTTLGPHDLLVKVAAASFCHTDLMFQEGIIRLPLPFTASHESAGTVVHIGSAVTTLKPGDRVLCGLSRGHCQNCADCRSGDSQYCKASNGMTPGFAEYTVADERESALLPSGIPFSSAAPLACAGITAWRGVLRAVDVVPEGEYIAVIGAGGGLGHLAIQFAHALGRKVIAVDARDEGLEVARNEGAELVLDARDGIEKVAKLASESVSGGVGATVNVSDARSAAALACAVTRLHGRMIQIAQPEEVIIPFQELIFRDIHVEGSLVCSPAEMRSMLELVAKHNVHVVKNVFTGLNRIFDLVDLAHSGKMKGKGVIVVDRETVEREERLGQTTF